MKPPSSGPTAAAIAAVVHDLDTSVSGVQSAIALEALVSAAFILLGGKVGDLIGRKRAYVLGLLGYAVGALSMTLSQSLLPIVIFWAVLGGLGASLLLPSKFPWMRDCIEGSRSEAPRPPMIAQKITIGSRLCDSAIATAPTP